MRYGYQNAGVLPANVRNRMLMAYRYLINKSQSLDELKVIWNVINVTFGSELWLVKKLEADKNRRKFEFTREVTKPARITAEQVEHFMESEE